MSAPWLFVPVARLPALPDPPGYIGTAPHLRGRVYKLDRMWVMEVVNTRTGRVVGSDNCRVWRKSVDGANHMTAAARGAWTHRYRQKDLK